MTAPGADWVPLFPHDEIPFILLAVLRCGRRLSKLHPTELENDLTDRLRDELDRDPFLRSRPTELFREVPLYDRKRARQKPLGRSDLMFLFSTGSQKPWPYFVIESKRLHVTFDSGWKSLVADYVTGEQGMMCFITQRYAQGLAKAAMLGYVFDGDTDRARNAVSGSITANYTSLKCMAQSGLIPSEIILEDETIHETSHGLSHGNFTIYHLFIAV